MHSIPVTENDPDPLLRADEVAKLLGGVNVRTISRLCERGEMGHLRVGRLVLIRASHVQQYLRDYTVPAAR